MKFSVDDLRTIQGALLAHQYESPFLDRRIKAERLYWMISFEINRAETKRSGNVPGDVSGTVVEHAD